MNSRQLLINRSIEPDEMHNRLKAFRVNWYTPKEYINSYKSVVACDYWNTTSSSGDWDGYFIQKIGKKFFLIRFSQENMAFRGGGYSMYTGNVLATWDGEMLSDEEIWNILAEDDQMYQ